MGVVKMSSDRSTSRMSHPGRSQARALSGYQPKRKVLILRGKRKPRT